MEFWETIGPGGGWNFRFARPFNDWEMEGVQSFLSTVSAKRISPQLRDRFRWKEAKDRTYPVKTSFDILKVGDSSRCLLKCYGTLMFL